MGKSLVKDFINSPIYIISILLISFLSWYSSYTSNNSFYLIAFSIYGIVALVIALFSDDARGFGPIILAIMFSYNFPTANFENIPLILIIASAAVFIASIIFIIKNRVNIFKGRMFLSLAIVSALIFVSSLISFKDVDFVKFAILLIVPLYLYLYGFLANGMKGEDCSKYVAKVFVVAGLVICAEIIAILLRENQLDKFLINGSYNKDAGWSSSNIAAILLNMCIGFTFYSFAESKGFTRVIYGAVLLIEVVGLIFTFSKAAIMILAILFIPYLVLLYKHEKQKKTFVIYVSCIIAVLAIGCIAYHDILVKFIEKAIKRLSEDITSGRLVLYELGIKEFTSSFKSVLIGNGLFPTLVEGKNPLSFYSYHSVIIQVLVTIGVIGFVAVVFNHFQLFKIVWKRKDIYHRFVFVLLLGAFIHSFGDNVYFMINYMLPLFIITGGIEASERQNKTLLENKPLVV